MAPLQATAQPRGSIIEPSKDAMVIPKPDPTAAEVPAGFEVEVVLSGLSYPNSVEFDDAGTTYVAESGYAYGDPHAPARALRVTPEGAIGVAAETLNGPVTDLLWHGGRLYISHRSKISALENGTVRDLVTGLPSHGDHHNNQMAAGPDGLLYFGQGTVTNSGVAGVDNFMMGWLKTYPSLSDQPARDILVTETEFISMNPLVMTIEETEMMADTTPFRPFAAGSSGEVVKGVTKANGTILRMKPDGSNLEVYAWGLRNPFGIAWTADGRLFCSENGFDDRGSRPVANAPDNVWLVRQGAWYGWPDYASGIPVTDARFKPPEKDAPELVMKAHPPVDKPFALRPPHAGVTKLAVAPPGSGFGDGSIFLAEFGDMAPMTGKVDQPSGFGVFRISPATRAAEPFFRTKPSALGPKDMEYVKTAGPKRPMDVLFHGGAAYVVDFGVMAVPPTAAPIPRPMPGTGVVWRIKRAGAADLRPPAGMSVVPG